MRSRSPSAHSEALARRLAQLSAELGDGGPVPAAREESAETVSPYDESWQDYTHIRQPVLPPSATPPVPPPVPQPGRHAAARRMAWWDLSGLRGRVALEPAHVALAAVAAALALGVTCWWVLQDDAGEPLPTSAAPRGLVTPAADAPIPSPTGANPPGEVVVDVTGKVRRPGIVVLDPGARVVDAVDAAGGARRGADLTGLNLARVLVDGEQIVVGLPTAPGPAASAAPSAVPGGAPVGLVNLNSAGLGELDQLPGVGPVTAQAIIDWRDANGGFRSVDQLLDVQGIGEKTLADLAPLVTL